MKIEVNVNGFVYDACYSKEFVNTILKPLIIKFQELKKTVDHRLIVFLAAPPAVGKSTLSLVIEKLSKEMKNVLPIQSLSLDGFHYPNQFLRTHKAIIDGKERYLSEVKGMPETFDLDSFKNKLSKLRYENIKWPIYDRNIHDVITDQIQIQSEIILIEGNWLLLNEEGWKDIQGLCDYSIFISSNESMLKERLINRKVRGGITKEEALEFYNNSDRKNVIRVMEHRLEADLVLEMQNSGEFIKVKEKI